MNNCHLLVIIVTYNAMQWIERCLESVKKSSVVSDVFIVDNGSTDGTQDYIKVSYPEFIFIQSEKNLGFGKANNIGLKYALEHEYDYIYLLNQDAWVKNDTFAKLIDIHKLFPEYGVLSPIQMQANEQYMDVNFAKTVCTYDNCKNCINDLFSCRQESVYEAKFVMAAHWLISRDCLSKVGGFSPSFIHYGEDGNYLERVIFHGFKTGIVPYVFAIHDRENRVDTIKKQIYFESFIDPLFLCSSLNSKKCSIFIVIAICLKKMLKYASFIPVKYCFNIICKWNYIKQNKMITKREKAFI